MSLFSRFGRAVWRGASKFFGTTSVPQSINRSAAQVHINPSVQQRVTTFLWAPIESFGNNNFVSYARRKASHEFLQRNTRRLALASFIGFYLTEVKKEDEKNADLKALIENFQVQFQTTTQGNVDIEDYPSKIDDYEIVERLGKPSSYGAVYHARYMEKELAVKMMFNHCSSPTSSCADTILKNFKREYEFLDPTQEGEETTIHPNIISLKKKFVDKTAVMYDSKESYPYFMPKSVDSDGQCRGSTLYMVMPKYSCTLTEYLQRNTPSFKTSLHLLCQLLEGVAHLEKLNIAHRDIKSDNILIKTTAESGDNSPQLAIADFGSCFNSSRQGNMLLSYDTEHVDRGGNPALMAPEILYAEPGRGVYLDYSKADVWAVGAITYEIFGQKNPLYNIQGREQSLPSLRSGHWLVDDVIHNILQEDPKQRLSACEAASLLCLLHFHTLDEGKVCGVDEMESHKRFLQLVILMSREKENGRASYSELFHTFMRRVSISEVFETFRRFAKLSRSFMWSLHVNTIM